MGQKPNIVLFITDSQGWNLLGESGSGFVHTPNIDRLAREGVSFERAYNCCPLCTPARAGLFTGQYPHNAGAWANDLPLGKTVKTLGSYFQQNGYRTAYIGKWHLDGTDYFGTGIPAEGYDKAFWYDGRNYLEELTVEQRKMWRNGLKTPESIHENNITREFTWAGRITERAKEFISDAGDQPYLLVISYDEPHGPSVCPPPYCDMYKDNEYPMPDNFKDTLENKPEHHREWSKTFSFTHEQTGLYQPLYFGCATFVDNEIGRVMEVVDRHDKDNTITIFTSDHGHYLGAHRLDGKGPALYEEVIRVPLIFRGSHRIAAGRTSGALVSHIDVIPTLLEWAGIEAPPILEGKSMANVLKDPDYSYRDEVLVEFNRFSITHDSWFGFIPIRAIVTQRYKLVINLHYTDELYDLEKDPGELNNLFMDSDYYSLRDKLHDRLIEAMDDSRDPFRGIVWKARPWRRNYKFAWEKGERRCRPYDGFLPRPYNYETGLPDE